MGAHRAAASGGSDGRSTADNLPKGIYKAVDAAAGEAASLHSRTRLGAEIPRHRQSWRRTWVCLAESGNPVIATGDGMIEIEECASSLGGSEETKRTILRSLRNRVA